MKELRNADWLVRQDDDGTVEVSEFGSEGPALVTTAKKFESLAALSEQLRRG